MGILDNIYARYETASPQFLNLWDFFLEDWGDTSTYNISRFDVEQTSLPSVVNFETDKFITGENYYTNVSYPDTVSLTLRENTDFSVYKYFEKWQSKIFDMEKGHFISGSPDRVKNGTIIFYTFRIKEGGYKFFSEKYILNKTRQLQTIVGQTLVQKAKQTATKILPYPMSLLANQAGSIASSKLQNLTNTIMPGQNMEDIFEEIETATFSLINLRYLGMGSHSLSYSGSEIMNVAVSFSCDRVERLKENKIGDSSGSSILTHNFV